MSNPEIPDLQFETAEFKLLFEQLDSENETISFLLKAHLFSEYHLDRLLSKYLGEKREPLERIDLRFAQKLSLIDAFALLPQQYVCSLRSLNKLRNRCVHTFNTRPSVDDVRGVFSDLPDLQACTSELTTVQEMLRTYMVFLFGSFSAAMYHLTHGEKKT